MGSRKSRRSACDLCRLYKLRCDRDERRGKSCGRCNAVNQPCKITLGRPVQAPGNEAKERENLLNATTTATTLTTTPTTNLEPDYLSRQLGRPLVPASGGGVPVPTTLCTTSATAGPLTSLAESVPCEDSNPMFPDHQNHTDYSDMDFCMPVPSFDSGDFSFMFPDAQLGLSNPATAELSDERNFEPHTALEAASLEPWRSLHGGDVSTPVPHRTMDDHELPATDSKSLTQLSLEIIQDYELLRANSPLKDQPGTVLHHCSSAEQHRPFNRMLHQAEQLWDILKNASAKLILPSLQFGTFQLSNSLPIQVKVLIDITSGMLLRITNALGINPAGVTASPSPASTQNDSEARLPFLTDPVAVSLRDTILSQEHDLPENEQHMSLHGIMVDILHLVDQKFK
ncbi:hypothetical protein PG994_003458 [Apiospora phragmitis]|uniref:Zn(2)-C6 fungal-type domain-containing protein n=1 Tax=Apiospora phragmitis TaxID=2905665 RepID=A0ABR1VY63_9PEZI